MSQITIGRSEGIAENSAELSVFVYGTLKPGGRYHRRYCSRALAQVLPAMVKGCLYNFPQWGYPAMALGEDWVKGYLLIFRNSVAVCDDVLRQLDTLEGVVDRADSDDIAGDDSYQRDRELVFKLDHQPLQAAWIYRMKEDQIRGFEGVYLPDGDWPVYRS